MTFRIILIALILLGSAAANAKPSTMKIDAIKEEWLTQIAEIARAALAKYDQNYGSHTFLAEESWTLMQLQVSEANTPKRAALKSGSALLSFEAEGESVTARLSVEDPGGDAWIFYCRIVRDRVVLEKMVEGSVPKSHPAP